MHNRIKLIRGEMSAVNFCERIGISREGLRRLEAGSRKPSELTLRAICSEFNVDRHWLETGEGEMYVPVETASDTVARLAAEHNLGPGGTALLRAAVRIMDELGPEALDRIIEETIPAIMHGSRIDDARLERLLDENSQPLGDVRKSV